MNGKIFSYLTSPLYSYFEATIGVCCSSWSPKDDFRPQAPSEPSEKAVKARISREERYSYRPRKNSFSLLLCIQKQREMSSPNSPYRERRDFDGPQEGWLEEELLQAAAGKPQLPQ